MSLAQKSNAPADRRRAKDPTHRRQRAASTASSCRTHPIPDARFFLVKLAPTAHSLADARRPCADVTIRTTSAARPPPQRNPDRDEHYAGDRPVAGPRRRRDVAPPRSSLKPVASSKRRSNARPGTSPRTISAVVNTVADMKCPPTPAPLASARPEVHVRSSGRNGSHDGYNFEALVVPRLYLVGSVAVRVCQAQRACFQGSDAGRDVCGFDVVICAVFL